MFQKPKVTKIQYPSPLKNVNSTNGVKNQPSPAKDPFASTNTERKVERRFIDFGFKERKDVVQW